MPVAGHLTETKQNKKLKIPLNECKVHLCQV